MRFSLLGRRAGCRFRSTHVPSFEQIRTAFLHGRGKDAIDHIIENAQRSNVGCVLTIGGDQLTGKSSLAKEIAASTLLSSRVDIYRGICRLSTGETMRALAAEEGISIGHLSRRLANSEDRMVDILLDYKTCEALSGGKKGDEALLVVEGRQPAVMATFCQSLLREEGMESLFPPTFRVYLKCSPVEQAYRFFCREIEDMDMAELVRLVLLRANLNSSPDNLKAAVNILYKELPKHLSEEKIPAMTDALEEFRTNAKRDEDDTARLNSLYSPACHYRQDYFYDLIVDTSEIDAKEKLEIVMDGFVDFLERRAGRDKSQPDELSQYHVR